MKRKIFFVTERFRWSRLPSKWQLYEMAKNWARDSVIGQKLWWWISDKLPNSCAYILGRSVMCRQVSLTHALFSCRGVAAISHVYVVILFWTYGSRPQCQEVVGEQQFKCQRHDGVAKLQAAMLATLSKMQTVKCLEMRTSVLTLVKHARGLEWKLLRVLLSRWLLTNYFVCATENHVTYPVTISNPIM